MSSLSTFREYMSLERRRASGLSPAELERWTLLRERLHGVFGLRDGPCKQEQRATVRIPTAIDVRFENLADVGDALMTNLSRGGIFVRMERPPRIGTELALRIRVTDPLREIRLVGEVVSHHVGPRLDLGQRGMGLRFKVSNAAEQARVDELYAQQVERHLGSA